jgi:hypothetical protein
MEKNIIEISKGIYDFEIARKSDLDATAQTIIGLLAVLAAYIYFSIDKVHEENIEFKMHFYLLIFSGVVAKAASCYFLLVGMFRYKFAFMNHPAELQKHYQELKMYDLQTADSAFEKFFGERYIELATMNGERNDFRSQNYSKSKIMLVISFLFCIVSSLVYLRSMIDWEVFNVGK